MAKKKSRLDDYPLFYEEIGRGSSEQSLEEAKKAASYDRSPSLSEEQVSKLSDDLRTPMKDPGVSTENYK